MSEVSLRRLLSLGILLVLSATTASCEADPSGERSSFDGTTNTQENCDDDPAYQLATIDEGGFVDCSDPVVDLYQAELDDLTPKCREPQRRLGDMAVVAQELLLTEKGVDLSLLRVLRAVEDSIPSSAPRMPCADIFATLVVLISEE